MTIDILVCSMDKSLDNIYKILLPYNKKVKYIISHQYTENKYRKVPLELLERKDVTVNCIKGRGLSRNRNNALKFASGDISLIADDDVVYSQQDIDNILEAFKKNNYVDIITFQISTYPGEKEYKKYSNKTKKHTLNMSLSVSSIEIAFKTAAIKENEIWFDERFGLGTIYPNGEEKIFLADALRKGLKAIYLPLKVVTHQYESSTKSFKFTPDQVVFLGAKCFRTYGYRAFLLNIISSIRLLCKYKKNLKWGEYLYYRNLGSLRILKEKK